MFYGNKSEIIRKLLGGASLTALVACTPATGEDPSASYGHREQSVSSKDRLTAAEWSTYRADQQYLHSVVKPGVRVRLNFADPRQYRFVMARLKLAGKTSKNSPYLFEALEARRQTHVNRGYKAGQVPELADENTDERREMHYLEAANLQPTSVQGAIVGESAPTTAAGSASSTFPDGAYYTWTDISLSDVSGYPLGDIGWQEEYDGGFNVTVSATGNPAESNLYTYIVSSYKMEDAPVVGFTDSYTYKEIGSNNRYVPLDTPKLVSPLQVGAPVDIRHDPDLISICLNRTWTQDCDYDLSGNPQSVKVPLQGSASIDANSQWEFDAAAIQAIRNALNAGQTLPNVGHIKLVLTNAGGGCDVTAPNTLSARMALFWNRLTVTGKTVTWDATGANSLHFDDGCRLVQDRAKLTMTIPLPVKTANGASTTTLEMVLSNDPAARKHLPALKPITITNSCLAEGTQIQLAGGTFAPIESLQAGAQVFNPYDRDDQALTVTDTAKGVETVPMVRIRDEAGRTLLMTEMHPIATADRGMVQARALRTGDVVLTQTGPSKIEVSRESYAGKVYNLKVGSEAEMASLGTDQTVVHANGFVVGDGQIQSKYESLAMTQKDGDIMERLPAQWHRDYLLSRQGN